MIKPLGEGYTIIDCDDVDLKSPENVKILEEIVSNAKKIVVKLFQNLSI
jgi:hypothetical protein